MRERGVGISGEGDGDGIALRELGAYKFPVSWTGFFFLDRASSTEEGERESGRRKGRGEEGHGNREYVGPRFRWARGVAST